MGTVSVKSHQGTPPSLVVCRRVSAAFGGELPIVFQLHGANEGF